VFVYLKIFIIFVGKNVIFLYTYSKSIVVMDEKIEKIVLELKSALEEKYGENLNKFYLVQFNNDVSTKWEGLISLKSGEEHEKRKYYVISDNKVFVKP
jgi:hypothetical protein